MCITANYFEQNPLYIPQAKQNNGINADVYDAGASKLDKAIKKHEKAYLRLLLGRELYAEYITSPEDAKWDALNALLYDTENLESPIANYIYFWYLDENIGTYDGSLFLTTKHENSNNHSVIYNQIKAWNEMVGMNEPILTYLARNINTIETTALISKAGWVELCTLRNSWGI